MEKILCLRDTSVAPSFETLENVAKQHLSALKSVNHDSYFSEIDDKIKGLEAKKLDLHQKVREENNKLAGLVAELENETENLKILEDEKLKLISENRQKETDRNRIRDKCNTPSASDEMTLENGRRKFEYYKKLTCMRWDYVMMKTCVKGYVTNKQNYIHAFKFDLNDENLEEKLWEEIEKAVATKAE